MTPRLLLLLALLAAPTLLWGQVGSVPPPKFSDTISADESATDVASSDESPDEEDAEEVETDGALAETVPVDKAVIDTVPAPRPVDSVGPAVLVFGDRHAFTVRAPGGWVADRRSGLGQGLPTVFYPEDESWVGSPVVIYCQVLLRGGSVTDRDGAIASDLARIRRTNPGVVVSEGDSIPLGNGHSPASVEIITGRTNGNSEAIAYIEERGSVILLILCGRTPDSFTDALPAFRVLVGSYIFVADDHENILRAVEAAREWSAKESP